LALPTATRWGETLPEADRLRGVFDALASAGRAGGGLLQVVVGRAPRKRVKALRRAGIDPRRVRSGTGAAKTLGVLSDAVSGGLRMVLDVFTPGSDRTSGTTGRKVHREPMDPYTAEQARQARDKHAHPPHFLIAVRVFTTGATKEAAVAAADQITSRFAWLSPHLTRRPIRRPRSTGERRWAPPGQMSLACVIETAAVAGLPAEPAAHHLPGAAARYRATGRGNFRTPRDPRRHEPHPPDHQNPRDRDGRNDHEASNDYDPRSPL
ncbi:MAG TPA: hypothetical protein VNV66_08350, partial [Pilimelia sp.]|nr:hypothetical protein [Pilimelia sp.]